MKTLRNIALVLVTSLAVIYAGAAWYWAALFMVAASLLVEWLRTEYGEGAAVIEIPGGAAAEEEQGDHA